LRDKYLPKTKKMELKDLANSLNAKLDGIETAMKTVEQKAASQGQMSENLEKELKGLAEKHTEISKMIEVQQKHIDAMEASNKRVKGGDSFVESITKNLDKIKAFQNGETSKVSFDVKSTMLNSTHSGDVGTQFRLPGVFDTPDRNQHIRQFMNVTAFNGNAIDYVTESWTDAVDTRAEGTAGSESSTVLTEATASSKIISTYLTVSKQSLSDIPYLMNHIQKRGMAKIMLKEDTQILNGSGAGNNVEGISVVASAYSDSLASSLVNRFDVLASAVTQATVNEYKPNLILLHPTDYDLLLRTKDSNGVYLFSNALMNNQPIYVHGARVVANTAVASDDFFVGDFAMGATLGIREDVNVSISDSHASTFTAGMVTILIEERIALPIYRTDAFIYGDMSNGLALGSA
jgi:HK97 family phage major capsid protein